MMAIGQGVIGGVQAIAGGIQANRARRELESLEQPFYKIQDELLQNRNVSAQQAQIGVPQAVKDYMTAETQRGLGTAMGALTQTSGNPNNVADLFQAYQRGIQQNAAMDAQQKVTNLAQFMQQNQTVAGQKTMQWTINEFQPFQNKVQMLQQRIGQGNQMLGSGINTMMGAGASYVAGSQNQDLIDAINNLNPRPTNPINAAPTLSYQQATQGIDQRALQQALQNVSANMGGMSQSLQRDVMMSRMPNNSMQNFG